MSVLQCLRDARSAATMCVLATVLLLAMGVRLDAGRQSERATGTPRRGARDVGGAVGERSAQSRSLTAASRLAQLWREYTVRYIRPSGEVGDPSRDGHVTSEAQSYAMLRAVLMRDRTTFDRVYGWTRAHLRRDDGLHAWLWDPATRRVLDANAATDGDIDIAWALALASVIFAEPTYADEAAAIVVAIRTHASLDVGARWLTSAGNWAGPERVVNLSYFYPYAAAWFERLDPGHGWLRSNDVGYDLLDQALRGPNTLPPDFNRVGDDGTLLPLPDGHALSGAFSYDSIRIVWRLELACRLGQARACELVERLVTRLAAIHERDGGFYTRYGADGTAKNAERALCFEGAMLPAMQRRRPALARQWRAGRLDDAALDALGTADDRYYDANWIWFGLALSEGVFEARLPSLEQLRRRRR